MVMVMMHQHHHSTAPLTHPINPPPPSSVSALRSPSTSTSNTQQFPSIGSPSFEHGLPLAQVKLSDIVPYDGAPVGPYLRAVEAFSVSLMRHNAAVIELGVKTRAVAQNGGGGTGGAVLGKSGRGVYTYRAGRSLGDMGSSPPCMTEVFRCMGRAARAALCAIARHLRLRSDVFDHLLDDNPLPVNQASSSVVVATFSNTTSQNGKGAIGGGKLVTNGEVEKGLLTLVSSDAPGLKVCDPNGCWYLADSGLTPGDLLLLTGKALSHATAGLRPAAIYWGSADNYVGTTCGGRTSLAFRLIPQSNAILDCSPITASGHVIPQSYVPIPVSQFMDDLSSEEDMLCSNTDNAYAKSFFCKVLMLWGLFWFCAE
ncbi:hypothetical protein KY290_009236 [Solanum tuberosum]|uniref:Uncharacterized protein n=1 Tax=Solanum tuberosum TaxID=4113 RepID=A0ABQ7WCV2_SOLTU|nr:hypothetical protein KY290_009236 [Solanum tuberosum]